MWGGKRKSAGRQKGKERDWNKYKLDAKRKKLIEASKSSMDLKNFFSPKANISSEYRENYETDHHAQTKTDSKEC